MTTSRPLADITDPHPNSMMLVVARAELYPMSGTRPATVEDLVAQVRALTPEQRAAVTEALRADHSPRSAAALPSSNPPHPMQPVVVDEHGVHRFKENAIVRYMLDEGTRANHFSLNTIARRPFSREDHEQLAQLIGYSVSGACDLSYMSDAVCNAALAESNRLVLSRDGRDRKRRTKRARQP